MINNCSFLHRNASEIHSTLLLKTEGIKIKKKLDQSEAVRSKGVHLDASSTTHC